VIDVLLTTSYFIFPNSTVYIYNEAYIVIIIACVLKRARVDPSETELYASVPTRWLCYKLPQTGCRPFGCLCTVAASQLGSLPSKCVFVRSPGPTTPARR
jgi:hypothetical protein